MNTAELITKTVEPRELRIEIVPETARRGHVPALPQGYRARPGRMADIAIVVDLLNACAVALVGAADEEKDDLLSQWTDPGFNLTTDSLVVFAPNGRAVGWMEFWDRGEPHDKFFIFGRVHPEHQEKGIGSYLTRWAETRAHQNVALASERIRVVMASEVISSDEAGQALFHQSGFKLARHFWRMAIELEGPVAASELPDGISLRTMAPGEEAAVVHAVRDAFKDHWGWVERPFEEEFQHWLHRINNSPDFDPSLWFLAFDGSEIAAMSLCWPKITEDPAMGWVGSLGVRRPWRRQGLGLAILRHSFAEFQRRGQRRVGLGVDAASLTGATRLYERAGMHVARQYNIYELELRPGINLATHSVAE